MHRFELAKIRRRRSQRKRNDVLFSFSFQASNRKLQQTEENRLNWKRQVKEHEYQNKEMAKAEREQETIMIMQDVCDLFRKV